MNKNWQTKLDIISKRPSYLSQEELSQLLSIDINTLNSWEKNITIPSVEQLIKISEIYQCKIKDLFIVE